MVCYVCSKCNAVFNKKSNYNYHINRIYDCSKKSIKSLNDDELRDINKNQQELAEISTNTDNLRKIVLNSNNNIKKQNYLDEIKPLFSCCYCNKKLIFVTNVP